MQSKNSPSPRQKTLQPLTPKEQNVLSFIIEYQVRHGYSPTYQEICDHFELASFNSVQNYLKQLQSKSYLQTTSNGKRSIHVIYDQHGSPFQLSKMRIQTASPQGSTLLQPKPSGDSLVFSNDGVVLPLLGKVAAGQPLESTVFDETFTVPSHMVKDASRCYVLKVKGESMIDEGIFDGDFLLVEEKTSGRNGELVVAKIDEEATVKRIYFHTPTQEVELRPSNSEMKSIWAPADRIQIKGTVLGLIRKYS
ncbi:MAG: transcriptional repressor LexA [Pseudobdellovibrionaceae bacterium]